MHQTGCLAGGADAKEGGCGACPNQAFEFATAIDLRPLLIARRF